MQLSQSTRGVPYQGIPNLPSQGYQVIYMIHYRIYAIRTNPKHSLFAVAFLS